MKYIAAFIIALIFLLPVCHASELNLVYDANGNLISGDGYFREYNGFNQLSKVYLGDNDSVLLQEFFYHPLEERVVLKKTYNSTGNITEKVFYWNKNFVTVVNDSGMYNYTYVYFNGQLVAQELDGVKTFIHSDHIGSATVVTDSNGDVIENTSYAPYGEIISGGTETRFNYEGKEYDSVVGDTDFNFRKYDQDLGIFTQPDTVIQNVYDGQSLNRYMFERGNPYYYTDPDGHILFPAVFGQDFISPAPAILGETGGQVNIPPMLFERNEIIPRAGGDGFKSGRMNKIFRDLGFKEMSEFGKGHPVSDLGSKFKDGGMAKHITGDKWEVIRWDSGHSSYPGSHVNHNYYKLTDNTMRLMKDISQGIFDHIPYFSQTSFMVSEADKAKESSSSSSFYLGYDSSTKSSSSVSRDSSSREGFSSWSPWLNSAPKSYTPI